MERSIEESFRVGLQENSGAKAPKQRKTTQRRNKTLFLLSTTVEFEFYKEFRSKLRCSGLAFVHNVSA